MLSRGCVNPTFLSTHQSEPNLPFDTPEFQRAAEAQAVRSDLVYKKDMPDIVEKYRGFQSLNPADHPVIKNGQKAKEITSDKLYHQEYEDEKWMVYYPVHITEGYESGKKAAENRSDAFYKKKYNETKEANKYNFARTEGFETMKKASNATSDLTYRQPASEQKFTQVADSVEHLHAKAVQPLLSFAFYKDKAKSQMDKYDLGVDYVNIVHCLHGQDLISDKTYRAKYEAEVKGTRSHNDITYHPEYENAKKNNQQLSKDAYKKKAVEGMGKYSLPADNPEFNQAKQNAENLSDIKYERLPNS